MLLALAYPDLSQTDFDFIELIRMKNDPIGCQTLLPHFTITLPTDHFSKPEFEKIIRKNLSEQVQVKFCIRSAMFMPPLVGHKSWYAFFVPDEGFSDLANMHRNAYKGKLSSTMNYDFPYIPHITVGSFSEKNSCVLAVNEMNRARIEIYGTINKIVLSEVNDQKVIPFSEINLPC